MLDKEFKPSRTEEYTPEVAAGPGACRKGVPIAGVAALSKVIVGVPEGVTGAAAVPPGFAADGVVAAGSAGAAGAASAGGVAAGAAAGATAGGAAGGGIVATVVAVGSAAAAVGTAVSVTAQTVPPTTQVPCPACYAGNWQITATVVALGNPPLCSYKPGDVGRQEGPLAFIVNSDGTFRLPDPTGGCVPPGTIDAAGTVSFVSAGDTCLPGYGVGLACPAGQGTGRCSSTKRCSGTLSQGGVQYTWVMTRVSN